ncbi:hypothetical protein QJQ45_027148 [Haematococcus lacustris]|nr:hypothetical protein QJQ45_027148 [Haematococcus lacustris]
MDTIHQELSKQAVDWVVDTGSCALNPSSKRLRLPQRCVSSGSQHSNMQKGGAARPAHGSEDGSMCNDSWSSQHRGFGRRVRVAGPASLEPNAGPRQGLIRSNSLPMADGMASDPVLASVRGPSASCAADVAWQTCPRPPAAGRQGPGLHGKLSEGCKPPLPGPLRSRAEQLCSGSSRRRLSHPECGGGNRPGVASKGMDAQPGMEQCWPWLEAGSVPLPFTTTKLQSWLQGSPRMSSRDVADMQYSMQAMQLDMQRLSTSNDLLLQSILAKMAFAMRAMGSARSAFSGHSVAFSGSNVRAVSVVRPVSLAVEAKKVCDLTGVKRNKANSVSFSNKKSRKWQDPNLQHKKVYWAKGQRWVTLKLCTRAIKTIEKNGLDSMAAEAGIDLWKLPFKDVRPERLQYLAENKGKVPVRVNPRAMKNPVKLAASKKLPKYPAYDESGKIIWIRQGGYAILWQACMEAAVAGSAAEPGAAQPSGVKITVKE